MSANNAGEFSGAGAGSYEQYAQDHRYEYDNGLVVMPVASRTAKHKVIRLHGGVGIRRVSFDAHRRGKPPVVPTMIDTDGDTFVGGSVTASLPIPNFQVGGYNWRVQGEYAYVQNSPRVVGTDPIPTGGFPFPIAPNDALATTVTGSYASEYTTTLSSSGSKVQAYAALYEAIGNGEVDHDTEQYVWPFTVLPTIFSSDYLIRS